MKKTTLSIVLMLASIIFIAGCSEPVDIKLLNYQGCRKQMTKEYIDQGIDPVAANMKSKAYCEAMKTE